MGEKTGKKVGRPVGYRMPKESRDKIRKAKLGSKHSPETRQKISEGVLRTRYPVSLERVMACNLATATKQNGSHGYTNVYVPRLNGGCGDYMRLAVATMEQHLGRKLQPGWEVHHWGDKDDNRVEMLTLCYNRQMHVEMDRVKRFLIDKVDDGLSVILKHGIRRMELLGEKLDGK